MRRIIVVASLVLSAFLNGCASVPMASGESDSVRKEFSHPSQGTAGLYIYRNSLLGSAFSQSVYVDGKLVGRAAIMTYFYIEVQPGKHVISTKSEFSENDVTLDAKLGRNYFVRQYIKVGFVGGSVNLVRVSEEKGKKGVLQCKLANAFDNDSLSYPSKTKESVIEQTLEPERPASKSDISGFYSSFITGNANNLELRGQQPEVRLVQNGSSITGYYGDSGGKIWGDIVGDTVKFEWISPSGTSGKGEWIFNPGSSEITGTWNSSWIGDGTWNLKRIE